MAGIKWNINAIAGKTYKQNTNSNLHSYTKAHVHFLSSLSNKMWSYWMLNALILRSVGERYVVEISSLFSRIWTGIEIVYCVKCTKHLSRSFARISLERYECTVSRGFCIKLKNKTNLTMKLSSNTKKTSVKLKIPSVCCCMHTNDAQRFRWERFKCSTVEMLKWKWWRSR